MNPAIVQLNKRIAKIVFPILILLSVIFYLERTAFLDNAFQIYLLVIDGYPRVMTDRWPALILRVLPWMGLLARMPLQLILILFSISFPLFHLLIWWLISIKAKAADLGLLLIALLTIGVCDTFYWCPSDLTQASAIILLLFALLRYSQKGVLQYLTLLGLMIIALFMHPLCIFPLGFLIVYTFIHNQKIETSYLIVLIVFILFWLIKSHFLSNWYDITKQAAFYNTWTQYKMDLLSIPVHIVFIKELLFKYHLIVLLFLSLSIYQLKNKQFLPWISVVVACLIYIMIIHIGHPTADNSFYREASYMVLSIFVVYPILCYWQSLLLSNIRITSIIISILMLVSIARITLYHKEYTQRIFAIADILEDSCTKQYIDNQKLQKHYFKMSWAIAAESWIISKIKSDKQKSLSTRKTNQSTNVLIGPFKEYSYDMLDRRYFSLKKEAYCE